jgi:hypothetical protein
MFEIRQGAKVFKNISCLAVLFVLGYLVDVHLQNRMMHGLYFRPRLQKKVYHLVKLHGISKI